MGVQHLRGAALLLLAICVSAGLQAAQPQGGLWWNPSAPGHGYDLSRSGNNLSVVWYSYGTDGLPAWYLAAAPLNGDNWSATLQRYTWNAQTGSATHGAVGSISLAFSSSRAANLSWQIGDSNGGEVIEPFQFSTASLSGADQTGLWYEPARPGYGLTLVTQGDQDIAVLYFFDAAGAPRWVLGSGSPSGGESSIPMRAYQGPCPNCSGVPVTSQSAGTVSRRFAQQSSGSFSAAVTLPAPMNGTWSVSDAGFSMLSDPVPTQAGTDGLSSRMEALFEVFMGRPLTKTELQKIVQENTAAYASMDEEARGNFDILIDILRTRRGTPMDFHVRKLLIGNAFFDEDREALGRKLMLSVDPVVVVNTSLKEVMTQRDILAFIQILKFHDTGDDPREIEKSRNDKDNVLAAELTVQLNDIAKEGSAFPEMLLHTSALWTGLVQYWPSLNNDQKESVRFYIATSLNGTLVDMPDELYIKLMGWTEHETSIAAMHRQYKIIMMMQGLQNRMLGMQQLYNSWYYGLRD